MSTTTTPAGVRIADMPDLGAVADASSFVAEHAGSGRHSALALRQYVAQVASVHDYGAAGNGVTDDTAALQSAISTGRTVFFPKGTYLVRNALTCATPGQIITGEGKGVSYIQVDSTFNLSAAGVFNVTSGVPGPQFRDFQVNFYQPDTNVRANLISYPPAFYAQNQPRCVWRGIKVNAAIIAIDIRQNAGGCSVIDCELCAFSMHVALDGAQDTVSILNTRFEHDLLTANQGVIYATAQTVGVSSGRCDDLKISNCLLICGRSMNFFPGVGTGGNTMAEITGCDFDSYASLAINAGVIVASACVFTSHVDQSLIQITGGSLTLSSCWLVSTVVLSNSQIIVSPTQAASFLNMSCCRCDAVGNNSVISLFGTPNSCWANINGCLINPDPTLAAQAAVTVNASALLTFSGNRFGGKTTATNAGLALMADAAHNVCGNSMSGWPIALPGTHTVLISANNN